MRVGDTVHRCIRVIDPATGLAVTGLTLAAFSVVAKGRGYGAAAWTDFTHGAALTEIGSGLYSFSHNAPPSTGWWRVFLLHASYMLSEYSWGGEIENQDLDSLYDAGTPYTATLSSAAELGTTLTLELIAYRWRSFDIAIRTSAGTPVDLTAYGSSLAMSIRSEDQTTRKLDLTNGSIANFVLTGDASGNLHIEMPESTGTPGTAADIYSILPAGQLGKATLYYEITGDLGGAAAKTVAIIRSSELRIGRRELGS